MWRITQPVDSLPQADAAAQQCSDRLLGHIRDAIRQSGPLPFSRFMQYALYEPGLGYYMNGLSRFGHDGDFVTAPEVSTLFSRCVARQCADIINVLGDASILEPGAGNGTMARDVLQHLQQLDALPASYCILEVSAALRERQQQTLASLPADVRERVQWLESLEGVVFDGIVLANEVLDALPVERFVIRNGQPRQLYVDWNAAQQALVCIAQAPAAPLHERVCALAAQRGHPFAEGYCSEVSLLLSPWLAAIGAALQRGLVLLVDYGYVRREYYHEQRTKGTLLCHYRHRAHDDVLARVGLQDITAQVDFTAVAEAAGECGLDVAGYTSQAAFLCDCGVEELLPDNASLPAWQQMQLAQQLKSLLLPSEMGDRFRAMALTKQYNAPLRGFSAAHDQRHRL